MKKVIEKAVSVLKGVSTLDLMIRNPRIILLLLILIIALVGAVRGGHSTLDVVDPSFNPRIQTSSFMDKTVNQIISLPNGKMLVAGSFNTYNDQPVRGLVRINADGVLDTTFNSDLAIDERENAKQIILQADGKILALLHDPSTFFQHLIRLNADGTLDPTFNCNYPYYGENFFDWSIALDANGRIIISAQIDVNDGYPQIIRLNSNGSPDPTFQAPLNTPYDAIATQGNKIIVSSGATIQRLNENGTVDSSFITRDFGSRSMIVQPDGKILTHDGSNLRRLNQDGNDDTGFTTTASLIEFVALSNDGKITLAINSGNYIDYQIRRLLSDGTADNIFTPYTAVRFSTLAVQADGGVLIGDRDVTSEPTTLLNYFVRLSPNGSPDPTFNTGTGFQKIVPGIVRAINVQPDGKILIGGWFNHVNDVLRLRIARLNADSTLDPSFQINTSGTGNYFLRIYSFQNIRTQSDGKIVVSGGFDYVVNGATKSDLVRLNPDGSIDSTFILGVGISSGSRLEPFNDGKLLVGTSRGSISQPAVPVKLLATGERDNSFNANLYPQETTVYIFAVAVQPDGKIIIGGSHSPDPPGYKSFLTRLNADGSLDTTFQSREQLDKVVRAFVLQPNGKIVISESTLPWITPSQTSVLRLNADGTVDPTFNAGTGANGYVNTMLLLSTGRIFVGGRFTTFNGQPRANLVQLNEDGTVFSPVYSLNDEVLSLAVDGNGRVFVGGNFTTIIAGNSGATRSYVAALIDAPQSSTRFDFDGDRRADVSVFRPSNSVWYLNCSTAGFGAVQFGLSTDKITPADFDGDGKTDIAVFRDGTWWLIKSSTNAVAAVSFGLPEDIPVPADYTGDGRDELAVYRNGQWWSHDLSNGNTSLTNFGLAADKPVAADYDGDGRVDQAVYRDGEWHINLSSQGYAVINFGLPTDQPVVGDYDGDNKTDIAVYRDGTWYLLRSSLGFTAFGWGLSSDIPAPADYDGDGKTDAAIYRDGIWYLLQSTGGVSIQQFGLANDIPIPSAYLP